jgi:hypothetical protein
MAEYDNTNSGALFENEKRAKESHPHLRGSCTIKTPDGEVLEFWVSAWQKTSKKGDDFFSLSFQLKDEQKAQEDAPVKKSSGLFKKRDEAVTSKSSKTVDEDLDDQIPF